MAAAPRGSKWYAIGRFGRSSSSGDRVPIVIVYSLAFRREKLERTRANRKAAKVHELRE